MDTVKWSALRQLSVRTLETLEEANLLRARPNFVYQHVANEWPFPLYPLDLPELEVDPDHLREAQRNCYPPDGYWLWLTDGVVAASPSKQTYTRPGGERRDVR
jgi:hypothetical protein